MVPFVALCRSLSSIWICLSCSFRFTKSFLMKLYTSICMSWVAIELLLGSSFGSGGIFPKSFFCGSSLTTAAGSDRGGSAWLELCHLVSGRLEYDVYFFEKPVASFLSLDTDRCSLWTVLTYRLFDLTLIAGCPKPVVVLGGSGFDSTRACFFLKPGQLVLGLASTDRFLSASTDLSREVPLAWMPARICCCLSRELTLFSSSLMVPSWLLFLLIILFLC